MADQPKNLIQEDDIGSGEKGKGQAETQKQIEQVPVQNVTQNSQQENRQGQGQGQQGANRQSGDAGNVHKGREPAPPPQHKRGQELNDDLAKSLVDTSDGGLPPKGN